MYCSVFVHSSVTGAQKLTYPFSTTDYSFGSVEHDISQCNDSIKGNITCPLLELALVNLISSLCHSFIHKHLFRTLSQTYCMNCQLFSSSFVCVG